jgi:serine/threonine protein kinase
MSDDFTSQYDLTSTVLGKGGFGIVYQALQKRSGEAVAVKVILKKNKSKTSLESLRTEAEILKVLDHPNIVRLYDLYENDQEVKMCMEMVTGGELFDRIVRKTFYSEGDARELVCILLSAIKHMHDKQIVHRDIKGSFHAFISNFPAFPRHRLKNHCCEKQRRIY